MRVDSCRVAADETESLDIGSGNRSIRVPVDIAVGKLKTIARLANKEIIIRFICFSL